MAETRFTKGMKVRLSASGRRSHIHPDPDRKATVVGFSRDRTCIWIVFDGAKGNRSIHRTFLEPAPEADVYEVAPARVEAHNP